VGTTLLNTIFSECVTNLNDKAAAKIEIDQKLPTLANLANVCDTVSSKEPCEYPKLITGATGILNTKNIKIEDDELISVSMGRLDTTAGYCIKLISTRDRIFIRGSSVTGWFYDIVCWARAKGLTFVA
jgi:hypothetical protein